LPWLPTNLVIIGGGTNMLLALKKFYHFMQQQYVVAKYTMYLAFGTLNVAIKYKVKIFQND